LFQAGVDGISLGIVSSPATIRGATGDDYDSSIQELAPAGADEFVSNIRSGVYRTEAGSGIYGSITEDIDPIGRGLLGLARSTWDRWTRPIVEACN